MTNSDPNSTVLRLNLAQLTNLDNKLKGDADVDLRYKVKRALERVQAQQAQRSSRKRGV